MFKLKTKRCHLKIESTRGREYRATTPSCILFYPCSWCGEQRKWKGMPLLES